MRSEYRRGFPQNPCHLRLDWRCRLPTLRTNKTLSVEEDAEWRNQPRATIAGLQNLLRVNLHRLQHESLNLANDFQFFSDSMAHIIENYCLGAIARKPPTCHISCEVLAFRIANAHLHGSGSIITSSIIQLTSLDKFGRDCTLNG